MIFLNLNSLVICVVAYLINSIVQFYLMNEFLGKQFHQLGLDVLKYITNTYSIENSPDSIYFPKVVMCDFKIREFGHPNFSHRYTIQCVLPINLYNQVKNALKNS